MSDELIEALVNITKTPNIKRYMKRRLDNMSGTEEIDTGASAAKAGAKDKLATDEGDKTNITSVNEKYNDEMSEGFGESVHKAYHAAEKGRNSGKSDESISESPWTEIETGDENYGKNNED